MAKKIIPGHHVTNRGPAYKQGGYTICLFIVTMSNNFSNIPA